MPHELSNDLRLKILENKDVFELVTREFQLATRGFKLVTCGFELVTRRFTLVAPGFELLIRKVERTSRGFELARLNLNSCF